jgi:hypothetical protein
LSAERLKELVFGGYMENEAENVEGFEGKICC